MRISVKNRLKGIAFSKELCYNYLRGGEKPFFLTVNLSVILAKSAKIYIMQRYRSGHNGADSKFCGHFGTSHLKTLDL